MCYTGGLKRKWALADDVLLAVSSQLTFALATGNQKRAGALLARVDKAAADGVHPGTKRGER